MMRTFLFLALLFVTSYCVNKPNNVDQIIDELVSLNTNLGKGQSVGNMLHTIKLSAKNSLKTFESFFSTVSDNCKAGEGLLQSFGNKLNGDQVTASAARTRAQARVQKNTVSQAKIAADLKRTKVALKNAYKRQANERKLFRNTLLEAEAKMTAIRHIRNIITDELLNAKGAASLLQVNTISSKLEELKKLVDNDSDPIFTTVVSSLIEMATSQNLNDQSILKKFLKSLSQLNQRLIKWRTGAIKSNKNLSKLNRINNKAKLKSIRAYGRLLVAAQAAVHGGKRAIEELNNALGLIEKGLKRRAKEASQWGNLCKDQVRVAKIFREQHNYVIARAENVGSLLK